MITHKLISNTQEWMAYRLDHDNASEAAAMLGLSKTTTRTELLHMKHTGLGKEFSEWVQRNVLDYGHEVEAKVRVLVEDIIGEDLYPVTCSEGRLSASCDGLTMGGSRAFECKQWNAEIAAEVAAGVMPEQHMPQCQQILMITGAEDLIFAVGDGTNEKFLTLVVLPDNSWFERIRAGWNQFREDLKNYQPQESEVKPIGRTPETLPALHIEVTGMVTASNLAVFKNHAMSVFAGINRELVTDDQFADAEKTIKWAGEIESRLAAAKQHALSQTTSIDDLFRTIDDISAEARRVRLDLDRLVKTRKDAMKTEIVTDARMALGQHIAALNDRLGKQLMPAIIADFAVAIKGKKNFDSMRDAVNTLLANAKIDANTVADRIQENMETLRRDVAKDHGFLFPDSETIVLKQPDDLHALVSMRITEHQKKEAARIEAERERIRREELARIAQEDRAKAAEAAAQAQRIDADARKAAAAEEARAAKRRQEEAALAEAEAALKAASAVQPVYPQSAPANQVPSLLAELNALLVRLSDAQIERVLHFVQSRYGAELGIDADAAHHERTAKTGYRTSGRAGLRHNA